MPFAEEFLEESSDDFLPLKGVLDSAKSLMEHTKTFVDGQNEELDESVANLELEVGKTKKCLKAFEEYRAELGVNVSTVSLILHLLYLLVFLSNCVSLHWSLNHKFLLTWLLFNL